MPGTSPGMTNIDGSGAAQVGFLAAGNSIVIVLRRCCDLTNAAAKRNSESKRRNGYRSSWVVLKAAPNNHGLEEPDDVEASGQFAQRAADRLFRGAPEASRLPGR